MQGDIDLIADARAVRIFGVNASGHESGNEAAYTNRTLPLLQEAPGDSARVAWNVTYRDVVILDAENRRVAVFNLTEHDLAVGANYDSLRALLLEFANR